MSPISSLRKTVKPLMQVTTPPTQIVVFPLTNQSNAGASIENLTHDLTSEVTEHQGGTADTQRIDIRWILLTQNAFMSKHICISGWVTWIMVLLPWHLPAVLGRFNWEWYMCDYQVAEECGGGLKGHCRFPSARAATLGGLAGPAWAQLGEGGQGG